MTEVNKHDLEAIGDVAVWLAEQSDALSAEQAVELLSEARLVHKSLGLAIDMLEAQALRLIEQPILVGTTAWSKKPTFKKRPDRPKIMARVAQLAVADSDTGEIREPQAVADAAIKLMADLYVSPSTVPKVGGVTALGYKMDDVVSDEHTGFELKRTELE